MKSILIFLRSCCILLFFYIGILAAETDKSPKTHSDNLSEKETQIIEKWRGTWDIKALVRQPQPAKEVTYMETFDWILDGHFLRSETSRKSDGDKSMSMIWYDLFTKSFRFVIYSASGVAVELPPPRWIESDQSMQWKSSWFSPTSYEGHVTFTDSDTIRWKSLWKDWKGTVIFDMEGTSIRRK